MRGKGAVTRRIQNVSADSNIQNGHEAREETVVPQWVGLSDEEAAQRLVRYGFNEVPSAQERKFWRIAIDVLKEPMLLLLIGTGGVYLLLGDPMEAAVLLVAIFGIIGITLYQERKTERALHALRDLSSPRALVIRQSVRKRIAGREVVPGDLLVISEGDRIPADGIILESRNVQVDESLLTGESLPVAKTQGTPDVELGRPGGDNTPECVLRDADGQRARDHGSTRNRARERTGKDRHQPGELASG
jgi:ATPase, P-type (transporting), HAD superfamily, subfamily IC